MNYFFYLLLIVLITGCSKENTTYQYVLIAEDVLKQSHVKNNEELVERFSEYWEAASLNDFETTYSYELPYLNFLKSLDWYLEFKTAYKRKYKVTLLKITPDNDDGDIVNMRINFYAKQLDANITEKWINVNGTWYHSYAQSVLPPKPPKVH